MSKIDIAPKIRRLQFSDVVFDEESYRDISNEALRGLKGSLNVHGYIDLMVVNERSMKLINGRQRFKIMKMAGVKEALFIIVDVDDLEAQAMRISLDNHYIQGVFNEALICTLDQIREEMPEEYLNLRLNTLREEIPDNEDLPVSDDNDLDDVPELSEEVIAQLGDIWLLGDHKILCGTFEDINLIMDSSKADLVFTDPPYNMNYKSKNLGGILNDKMDEAAFIRLILSSVNKIKELLRVGGSYYICMSADEYPLVYHQIRKCGFKKSRQLIWVKPSTGMGAQEYRPQYEVMMYGYTGKRQDRIWNGGRTESNLWEFAVNRGVCAYESGDGMTLEFGSDIDTLQVVLDKKCNGKVFTLDGAHDELWRFGRPTGDYQHPTQKPVALVERAIRNSSNKGDCVVDLFGGSGSTLIAAERLGRIARLTELDPKYVDVEVKRWEYLTGKKAECIRR